MSVLPPGTILQHLHIRRRIKANRIETGRFLDLGAGSGHISELLLSLGMKGDAFDLNPESCSANEERNRESVNAGALHVHSGNFLEDELECEKADLVISSMVIEHLVEEDVDRFFATALRNLKDDGSIFVVVPGSNNHWGIEDEIAGHKKRYEFECFDAIARKTQLELVRCDGLTYPLSNLLLPLSNRLVNRSESYKSGMSDEEKTVLSGDRAVAYKTEFPVWLGIFLNRITMYPFDLLQRINSKNPNSMVLFAEFRRTKNE